MNYSPIAIKRRRVLGNLYDQCDNIESIPVYLDDTASEIIGYADESLGRYADAFLFRLPEDICKKLSMSGFEFGFDYNRAESVKANQKQRFTLNHILLIAKKKADVISPKS